MKPLLSNDLALDVSIENMLMQVGNKPERVVQFYKYNQIRSSMEISNILDNANKIYVAADYHLNKPKRIKQKLKKHAKPCVLYFLIANYKNFLKVFSYSSSRCKSFSIKLLTPSSRFWLSFSIAYNSLMPVTVPLIIISAI